VDCKGLPTQKNSGEDMTAASLCIWILYNAYAFFEGKIEGFYWHFTDISKREKAEDIHASFLSQRFMIWLIAGGIIDWKLMLALSCSFPMMHLGSLYYHRNKLNPKVYEKGFFAQRSNQSTQKVKLFKWLFLTFERRLAFFVLSIVLLFL
jgi:hypothetical protein